MKILERYGYLLTPVLITLVLMAGFGFNGFYGQDSHEYLRFAKSWKAEGLDLSVVRDFRWPIGFPLAGILISFVGIPLKWALVLVSLLSVVGALYYTNRIIGLLYGKDAGFWLLIAAATQVYFVRGGFLAMSDMLCCFLIVLSFYHLFRYRKGGNVRFLLYLLLTTTAAFFTRYASAPLLLPVWVSAFHHLFRNGSRPMRIIGVQFLVALAAWMVWSNNRFFSLGGILYDEWDLRNVFALTVETPDNVFTRTVPNGVYIFGNFLHLGYLSAGAFLLPFYKRIGRQTVIWAALLLYFGLIIGLNTQNYRFLILIHPLVLILLYPVYEALENALRQWRRFMLFLVGILLINASFFVYSFRKTYAVFATEKEVAGTLIEMGYEGPVYGFYVDQSLPTYGLKNEIRSLYTELYTEFEHDALVIYNPSNLTGQWKSTTVGRNWDTLNANYTLDTVRYLNRNWRIYRIR